MRVGELQESKDIFTFSLISFPLFSFYLFYFPLILVAPALAQSFLLSLGGIKSVCQSFCAARPHSQNASGVDVFHVQTLPAAVRQGTH
jgi:hypothetical protein